MDKQSPVYRSKLSRRTRNTKSECSQNEGEETQTEPSTSYATPALIRRSRDYDEDSPAYPACTQEGFENVDVVWDWNSPQALQKRRPKKRLIMNSPKNPIKRYPSNNQTQNFDKLREELQSLRNELAMPDSEDCLVLSPLEEDNYQTNNNQAQHNSFQEDDFFNDSIDEDLLIQFSQQVESKINNNPQIPKENNPVTKDPVFKPKRPVQSLITGNVVSHIGKSIDKNISLDDSFDLFLSKVDVCELKPLKVTNKQGETTFSKIKSESNMVQNDTKSYVEFHRTKSFELSNLENGFISPEKLKEIERKRLEALAKLKNKKKTDVTILNTSPGKCSLAEIEKKRLQAIAKLEAKKQSEIIERKRQEALKRLANSRKKNALSVKSSLTNIL